MWKVFFSLVLVLVLGGRGGLGESRAQAAEPSTSSTEPLPPSEWRIWLEPRFLRSPTTEPVPGARHTDLAAGASGPSGNVFLSKARFDLLGVDWKTFVARARENANALLSELPPRYVRDSKKVIQYAVLESARPIVAEAVLAPRFLETFNATLGEKVLVVVPNRSKAFVFPALAGDYTQAAAAVLEAYRGTKFPVSLEVFEVSATGWRTIGAYEP